MEKRQLQEWICEEAVMDMDLRERGCKRLGFVKKRPLQVWIYEEEAVTVIDL